MPLILISGYPSSGKTHRANQLVEFFKTKIHSSPEPHIRRLGVSHVDDRSLGLHRDVYGEARTEKDARAAVYSAIKRVLGRDEIVVADGMNYVKGFRYQLYCEAKAVQTTSCVVHIGTAIPKCQEINARLLSDPDTDGGYAPAIFDNLIVRYEEPNGMTRWDSPLFTVLYDDESPPFEAIWEAMIGSEGAAKVVKSNLATVQHPPTSPSYLYELDKSTQEILSSILDWQKDHPSEQGGRISLPNPSVPLSSLPNSSTSNPPSSLSNSSLSNPPPPPPLLHLQLPLTTISLPQLQRLRRQFVALNRRNQIAMERIGGAFVEFLEGNLDLG